MISLFQSDDVSCVNDIGVFCRNPAFQEPEGGIL